MSIITESINVPIFNFDFTVIIYENDEEILEFFDNAKFDIEIEEHLGFLLNEEDMTYLVLRSGEYNSINYPTPGIIAHESKHLVNQIFKEIRQKLDVDNDEVECYLLGWIVDEVAKIKSKLS